jgi:hypothetical protein
VAIRSWCCCRTPDFMSDLIPIDQPAWNAGRIWYLHGPFFSYVGSPCHNAISRATIRTHALPLLLFVRTCSRLLLDWIWLTLILKDTYHPTHAAPMTYVLYQYRRWRSVSSWWATVKEAPMLMGEYWLVLCCSIWNGNKLENWGPTCAHP